jgi:hypothetical protein
MIDSSTSRSSAETVSMITCAVGAHGADSHRRLDSRDARHVDVHENDIWGRIPHHPDGVHPVGGLADDGDPVLFEQLVEATAKQRVVLNPHDADLGLSAGLFSGVLHPSIGFKPFKKGRYSLRLTGDDPTPAPVYTAPRVASFAAAG